MTPDGLKTVALVERAELVELARLALSVLSLQRQYLASGSADQTRDKDLRRLCQRGEQQLRDRCKAVLQPRDLFAEEGGGS